MYLLPKFTNQNAIKNNTESLYRTFIFYLIVSVSMWCVQGVCVSLYVCAYPHSVNVCAYICACMLKSGINFRYLPYLHSILYVEMGSLVGSRVQFWLVWLSIFLRAYLCTDWDYRWLFLDSGI